MNFSELVIKRYSVRAYKPDPVEDDKLEQVLEVARMAPTAANRQPLRVIVAKTKGREQELKRVYGADWFTEAPIVICVCTVKAESWVRRDGRCYADVDAAIVMDHITLQAADLGLGTCWIGAFDPAAAREVLQIPEGWEPVLFTPLGYPADEPREKKRREISELVISMQ